MMSDSYPDDLNPFSNSTNKGRKLKISNSFKGLKRTVRRSFRIKNRDEHEVTIREKQVAVAQPSKSSTCSFYSATWLDPRSRFKERLSLRQENSGNPFGEDDNENNRLKRKVKKRAPLPPGVSRSSQDLNSDNLDLPSDSTWSLTSADTQYTSNNISRNESLSELQASSIVDDFRNFNEKMEKLKDDSNNNVINKEEKCRVPDLVISCPSDSESTKDEIESTNKNCEDVLEETIAEQMLDKSEDKNVIRDEKNCENRNAEKNVVEIQQEHVEEKIAEHSISPDNMRDFRIEINQDETQEESTKNKVIDENESVEGKVDVLTHESAENSEIMFHVKKSLYIGGSREQLDESNTYTQKLSIYIEGSTDNLDVGQNNQLDTNDKSDKNEVDDVDHITPTPKQRKNRLSKNMLLGI